MRTIQLPFREKQRLTILPPWIAVGVIFVMTCFTIYRQEILERPLGHREFSTTGLFVLLGLLILFMIGLANLRMKTKINKKGIKFQFTPFIYHKVKFKEIDNVEVVDFGYVGGWGIHTSPKYGTVYSIKGHTGLAIELKNGEKFCIGTQRAEEIEAILKCQS